MTTLYLICIVIAIGILLAHDALKAMGAFVAAVEFVVDLTGKKL